MLVRDILLENKRFNLNLYGAWLDAKHNEVIPIADQMGHSAYVQRNTSNFEHPPGGELSSIMLAYYNGLIRVVFNKLNATQWDISMSGFDNYIKGSSDLILEMLDTAGSGKLEMSVLTGAMEQLQSGADPDYISWNALDQRFFFPEDEKKLQSFLRSL